MRKNMIYMLAIGMGLAAIFLATLQAKAGSWAVISVENLPLSAQPGEPISIRFRVLQHGNHPLDDLKPNLKAWSVANKQNLTFEAHSAEEPGVYEAELVLPEAGTWGWSIQAFTTNQPMPSISVVEAGKGSIGNGIQGKYLGLGAGLAAVALIGLAIWLRSSPYARLAPLLLASALLVGVLAIQAGSQAFAQGTQQVMSNEPVLSLADYGNSLFTAKGCITCHKQRSVAIPAELAVYIGPDLSTYTGNPEFMQRWLQNPKAIKPDTPMPNLHLKPAEIEALIAFLNQSAAQ